MPDPSSPDDHDQTSARPSAPPTSARGARPMPRRSRPKDAAYRAANAEKIKAQAMPPIARPTPRSSRPRTPPTTPPTPRRSRRGDAAYCAANREKLKAKAAARRAAREASAARRMSRREKVFGPGRTVPLDRNAKARVAAYARAWSARNRQPGQHKGPITRAFLDVLDGAAVGLPQRPYRPLLPQLRGDRQPRPAAPAPPWPRR